MALAGLRPLRGRRSVPGRGPGRKIPIIQYILPQLCKYRQPPTPGGRACLDPPRLFQYSRENAPGARFCARPGEPLSLPLPGPGPGRAARNPCGNCPKNPPFSFGFPRKREARDDPRTTPQRLYCPGVPFLAALPDPGLRTLFRQQGDPFFRRCALALWQAGAPPHPGPRGGGTTPSTPAPSPRRPSSGTWCPRQRKPSPSPPFLPRLLAYDRTTGRQTARAFLDLLAGLPPCWRGADGGPSPSGHRRPGLLGRALHPVAKQAGLPGNPCPHPAGLPCPGPGAPPASPDPTPAPGQDEPALPQPAPPAGRGRRPPTHLGGTAGPAGCPGGGWRG